ncbi:TTC31 protein, partial [Daphoenositta chrysoptera]|nr:TTC31 protein [Daphoenositta chrysoptera]
QELVAEEERAKRKAEKKKLKKKKQKDRKKREKLGQELKSKENTDSSPPSGPAGTGPPPNGAEEGGCCPEPSPGPGDSTPSVEPGLEDTEVTEEELDLSCTFVCKAREKAGVRLPPLGSDQSPGTQNMEPSRKVPEKGSGDPEERPVSPQPRAPSPSTVEQSLALAGHGIAAAQAGLHTEAVYAFTVALELNPREHRLLGNRSYCLEKLGRFEEALADAEAALALRPGWPKGSFRKGKALRGLQVPGAAPGTVGLAGGAGVLGGAGGASPWVSPCPPSCSRLRSRCFSRVRDRGGWVGGTPGKFLRPQRVLNPSGPSAAGWTTRSCQDTGDTSVKGGSAGTPTRDPERRPAVASGHLTLPPSHPARDCFPLWVGNVTSHINEKVLRRAFGRFGEIRSVRLLPGRRCAFINFSGKVEAEEAYRAMQGATVEGSKLLLQLKHPSHATPAP